ncbi:Vinorine synthase [Morella rubra]|uniref:Vinorine synthase n=1 Tax=Morella rubra TaxID=262757 RepID=A0A6A1UV45_9ROSI|nr:Vinorine synthase [Morella rubra]
MKVEIISKEFVKPTSPTPPNLKTHKLSLLDQLNPPVYVPMIFFYPTNQSIGHAAADSTSQRGQLLKQSLSETLTRFYPFAGKIKDNLSIDCNDEGVDYLEARVHCHLADCLNQLNLRYLRKFLPQEASWKEASAGDPVAMVQVNNFACGGIVIGILVYHMIADGAALSVFLKGWAATCRKASEAICPNFDAASIFKLMNKPFPTETLVGALSKSFQPSKSTLRRLVFDASTIASLKAKATSLSVQNPTRVEVVSALLWKCISAALQVKSGSKRPTVITHAVNFRPRSNPPFPESTMGNLIWVAGALWTGEEADSAYRVSKLREAVAKINADFVKNLQGDEGFSMLCNIMTTMGGVMSSTASASEMDYIWCTSWCNFGLYDIDFGWGKPVWASCDASSSHTEQLVYSNKVILMDTRSAGGVEAWVSLKEGDMAVLEQDKELLAFASLDPSPLH